MKQLEEKTERTERFCPNEFSGAPCQLAMINTEWYFTAATKNSHIDKEITEAYCEIFALAP